MPRRPLTNEEILRKLCFEDIYTHRRWQEHFFTLGALTLTSSLPIPQVHLEHVQDSCNKSTAIYSISPHLEGNTRPYCDDAANRKNIVFSIYEQWFRDHHVDIDFGNFVAKLIRVEIPSAEKRPTVGEIINIHEAWCKRVETNLLLCSEKGAEIDDPSQKYRDCFCRGIKGKQKQYYNLKPLFRALIMITDQNTSPDAEKILHLFRTSLPSGLSAPICFESISPKLKSDESLGHPNDDLITTTLSAAIDFIIELESREEKAFPQRQRDPSIVDEHGGGPERHTEAAKRFMGYTGPEINATSVRWVKLVPSKDVRPLLTPIMMQMRQHSNMARYQQGQQSEERKLYTSLAYQRFLS